MKTMKTMKTGAQRSEGVILSNEYPENNVLR
jgi:hypothetical protein